MKDAGGAAEVKACCAALYASDWARLLLGDSFHPGGLALTERLGELLDLRPGLRVLDVASGQGASALRLAQRFGCEVVGVDYSAEAVAEATRRAEQAGQSDRVRFEQGDAERLPLERASFDALVCECAFCTFPDKPAAAREMARVLRPGGLVVVEALNARGVPALARRLREIAASYRPRVRPDAPARARGWLASHGIELVSQVPLYVPPRRLARALDHAVTQRIVRSLPGVSGLAAHAFWLVGRKRP